MKRVLCAGAPVPRTLWTAAPVFLPGGRLHSPYGATEALPVSTVSSDEVDPEAVRGACVGRPVAGVEVRIIDLVDAPLSSLASARELPFGDVGEIIVRGANVTRSYDASPEATAAAKIPEGGANPDAVWHRMGDCGYRDAEGRLWFCGRKVERVQTAAGTLFTEPCEQVFRRDPLVGRCALIGVGTPGAQVPALVVERRRLHVKGATVTDAELAGRLRALGREHAQTKEIRTFYFRRSLPVDVRHNAKIHRLSLARWAATVAAIEVP